MGATMTQSGTDWTVQRGANGALNLAIGGTFIVVPEAEGIELGQSILLAANYNGSWPPKTAPTSHEVTSYSKCASGTKKPMPRGTKGK
jgi:hypothetical protein